MVPALVSPVSVLGAAWLGREHCDAAAAPGAGETIPRDAAQLCRVVGVVMFVNVSPRHLRVVSASS